MGNLKKTALFNLFLAFLFVVGGIFVFPNTGYATDFYVSTSGTNDASHGTGINGDAWATLEYALEGSYIDKGDTVYIQAGTYIQGQTNVNNTFIGAGDGSPVIVKNYADDVVTIQTAPDALPAVPSTPANGLFFINSVDMTFDGINIDNNSVGMGSKYLFALYSTSTSVDLIFQNASIDGDSAGNIRIFKLYGSQPHNLTVNKTDITNGGIIVETDGTSSSNNNVTFYSSLIRSGFVGFFASNTGPTNLVLKNNLFTRFTGYGIYMKNATATVVAKNNIFLGGGSYVGNIWNIGTDFGLAAIANNALFDVTYNYYYTEDDPFDGNTFGDIISSTQVVPYIPEQNWFVDPSFTSLGTDYTLQAGSLIAARGTNDHPPGGTDINNASYGTNDVGPYVNPTLTALPSLDTSVVGWHGDSIMAGTGVDTIPARCYSVYDELMTSDTVANYGIGGQFSKGLFWAVDQSIWTGRESSVVISIGINDLFTPKDSQTNTQVSSKITAALQKISDAGIEPIYLGVSSVAGNPPNVTSVDAVTDAVATTCTSEGWSCGSVQTQMENNDDWKTDYYDDLITDVHPNDSGHAVFARMAEYLSFTRNTMGTDEVDIGAGARLYYDGKFRNLGTVSGTTADFTVTPVGGVGSFDFDDKSAYMDISISTWETTGDKDKQWTASSSTGAGYIQATDTVYTIGDLLTSSYYQFKVDSAVSTDFTGSSCTDSYCQSDGSGQLSFTYTGGYSSHDFALEHIAAAPTPTNFSASSSSGNIDLSVDSFSNDTLGSAGYYFENITNSNNSGWIATNTWQEASPDHGTNDFTVKYRNADGTETTSIAASAIDNNLPVANAGLDQTINEGASATLDSSASADADSDTLTATWTKTTDISEGCTLTGVTVTTIDKEADYSCVFSLTVNDGYGDSVSSDTMTLYVNNIVQEEEPESPEDEETTIEDIGLISGSESGPGIVTLYDNSNVELCSVQAWNEGGAVPFTVRFLNTNYIAVVKNKTGSTIHLYDLNCSIVEKKKLSAKLHPRNIVVRNFLGKSTSQEIGLTSRRGSTVYGKIFRYNPTKDKWYLLRQKTFRPVTSGYTLKKTKKGNILIKKNNKILHKWEI